MLARTSKGLVLVGRQSHTSGVLVADRLAVRAARKDTGEPVAVVVDPTRPGVAIDGDADTFGQRLAAGGSVEFDDVPVGTDDALGSLAADEDILSPLAALAAPVGRLFSAQLLLGMAEGVLAEAREYSRTDHSPLHPAWPVGTPHDPQVQTAYGESTVLTRAASALTDQALEAVRGGLACGEALTYDEYADISVLVAMAETAVRRVQDSTGAHHAHPRHHRRPLHLRAAGLRPLLAQCPDPHPVRARPSPAPRRRRLLPQRCPSSVRPARPTGGGDVRAFSWRSLMAAEITASSPELGVGLDQLLENERNNSSMSQVFLAIPLILLVGIAIDLLLFSPLERRVLRSRGLQLPR
ncbi:hypothetical protein [Streptomyces scabichelini]|uniref:hypothetical protein n=1 Tax=Streptomyces scabichelini TaxID=2711217 RepID=UPI001F49C320|nr:hypothetical protein [Streptomyces scabichelini]